MFGRIVPRKGYELFVTAAQRIKQTTKNRAEFRILGLEDTSRKDSVKLFHEILAAHEQRIITYIPPTDNVIPIIHESDVIVLPSQYNEGVPRSLLEAMACGKPIITTNWKGCRDTVDRGINGLLIEKGNIQALQKAFHFFINAGDEVLHKMGAASRKKAEKEFDERIVLSKYIAEISS